LFIGVKIGRNWDGSAREMEVPVATADIGRNGVKNLHELKSGNDLQSLFSALKGVGLHEYPPVSKFLKDAISSGDKGEIQRAFHDAYFSRHWKMSEVVPALIEFTSDPDPFVRLNAAEALYAVGNHNGFKALVGIVLMGHPSEGIGQDIRIEAAEELARFREQDAVGPITTLYSTTPSAEVSLSLANLGAQLPDATQLRFVASDLAIEEYAKAGMSRFLPQISAIFRNTSETRLKNASAWALASLSNDQSAIAYLAEASKPAIEATANPAQGVSIIGRRDLLESQQALKFLGSIQNPVAKETLVTALKSQIPEVVRIATVNLIFNQREAEQADAVVAAELSGEKHILGATLALNLAAQSNDPEVKAAGEKLARQEGSGLWDLFTVERKSWPIYNWIDDYVVKLNASGPPR